jgi:hypothetical protein
MRPVHSVTVWRALAGAALVLLLVWVASHLRPTTQEEERPPTGEARWNTHYVLEHLIRELGGTFTRADDLTRLPPLGATLWLDVWAWEAGPQHSEQLRAWVDQGGHLVVPSSLLGVQHRPQRADTAASQVSGATDDTLPWIPLRHADAATPQGRTLQRPAGQACFALTEWGSAGPYLQDAPTPAPWTWCAPSLSWGLQPLEGAPRWALRSEGVSPFMRVRLGLGSVTAYPLPTPFEDARLVDPGRPHIAAALLQLRPGTQVWLLGQASREPLWTWLWHRGAVAVVLGALALAAALWRQGVRFGPLSAPDLRGRRSMAEQIQGTARFLWRHEPAALHGATLAALDSLSERRCPAYRAAAADARVRWLARIGPIEAPTLRTAMDPQRRRRHADWMHDIHTLETARRGLLRCPLQDLPPFDSP